MGVLAYAKRFFFVFVFCFFLKAPKHTHTPQTPTRTALAHSTRTKSTCFIEGALQLRGTDYLARREKNDRIVAGFCYMSSVFSPYLYLISRYVSAYD